MPKFAGKTTLLNTILDTVDRSWERGGSLTVNGISEPLSSYRRIIGYVPQEDIMSRELSVYDNIRYAANCRLPVEWTSKQREDHVNAVISAMQLKHVQDVRIGDESLRGISGGQRKRVNIGMELAAAPSLLLLDEPTSGLDSHSAMEICRVLKDVARVSSLTVALVVHQPRVEIWNELDQLLLLAPGGLTVYQGPQRLAVKYFTERFDIVFKQQDNPADTLMDLIAEQGAEFVIAWKDGGDQYLSTLDIDLPDVVSALEVPEEEVGITSNCRAPSEEYTKILVNEMPMTKTSEVSSCVTEAVDAKSNSLRSDIVDQKDIRAPVLRNRSSTSAFQPFFHSNSPVRVTPGFIRQFYLSLIRNLWKQAANTSSLTLEAGLGAFAGLVMGALIKVSWQGILKPPYSLFTPTPREASIGALFNTVGLAISLAAASAGVSVFGEEQIVYRREVAAGHSHIAYYCGTSVAQIPRLCVDALHFAFLFHVLSQPLTSFGQFLGIVFLLYFAIYGLAAIVSFLVSRRNAALLAVVVSLIFSSMTQKGGQPEPIQFISASRWASEALFSVETRPYRHIMQVDEAAERLGYTLDRFSLDLFLMFIVGVLYRFIAYGCMRRVDRKILVK
jgi:ABC-type multidrug transport system ATPase subunit/ABC-type multidrug transport system permease subunit